VIGAGATDGQTGIQQPSGDANPDFEQLTALGSRLYTAAQQGDTKQVRELLMRLLGLYRLVSVMEVARNHPGIQEMLRTRGSNFSTMRGLDELPFPSFEYYLCWRT